MEQIRKKWKVLPGYTGEKPKLNLPDWLFNALANRGLKTKAEITSYLEPKYEDLISPDSFLAMDNAVERIVRAREKNEKIVVYGDYDVDGITATALVFELLNKIGLQNVETYIPHREEEGYGLNKEAIDEIIKKKTGLLITVDCGISSRDLVSYARENKLDVLVCDHHEIEKEKLPVGAVTIHPQLTKRGTSPQSFCACGMAFFLARAVQEKFLSVYPKGQEKWLLDLVALATICDVVPLVGQNRILASYGLRVLAKTKRVGLAELIKSTGTAAKELNSYTVGFLLGPRINAAGRLEHAKKALELVLTHDPKRARVISTELSKLNTERQKMCDRILFEAKGEIETSGKKDHEIFLLSNKNWPKGVVGIIASKLSDAYSRPVIVFEDDGKAHHGSARSIEGFDITAALSECEKEVIKFGGHARAAGLTVAADKFILFSDKLLEIAKGKIKKEDLVPGLIIDSEIREKDITEKTIETISGMEPFGYGNHNPTFLLKDIEIENIKKVGSAGEHLKFCLKKSGTQAILFGNSHEVSEKKKYDLVLGLRYNFWNQRRSVEARILDLREAE